MLRRQMQLPLGVGFVDRRSGARVNGLVQIAGAQHLLWWTGWRYDSRAEDRTWDWWGIYRECGSSAGRYECYDAVAANDLQGLIVLDLRGRKTRVGKAIIVDYLANNPANRSATCGLKHVGVALIAAEITRSLESGARGAIWLESLPRAAGFYENLGMAKQSRRSVEGNLIYVLEPETAEQLLEEIKAQGIIGV